MFMKSIVTAAVLAVSVSAAPAADISGAGATFPFPIYAKWADAYKKDTGNGLNYQSIGSGAGIKQIRAKTVTFGATDKPLEGRGTRQGRPRAVADGDGRHRRRREPRRRQAGRLPHRRPDPRRHLSRQDHQLERPGDQGAQPEARTCRTSPIVPIHRADGSGTTFNFTYYLGEVSPDWKSKVGVDTTVDWPGGIGAKGNDGVANNVATTKGAIGYVEYAYAKQNKLTHASMVNKAGKTVEPTLEAFQAAAANADWAKSPGFYQILANEPGDKSWPMTAATFILMYKTPANVAASNDALSFFKWSYEKGGKMAEDLDYIPMPDNVVKLVETMWAKDIVQK